MKFDSACIAAIDELIVISQRLRKERLDHQRDKHCPKCLSSNLELKGHSKMRKDGTRSQRILCNSCGKNSTVD